LVSAIISENIKLLSSIKGLGKKTAERLVLELKNSFDDMQLSIIKGEVSAIHNNVMEETIDTLIAMGLTRIDATNLVKTVAVQDDTTETLIKKCLKNLNR
jgi:Holliday junction DNA helicase RuvA